eukprot:9181-Heterococcus_DN1.PRE.2
MAGGLQGMLKDGHTSFEGVDEAIMRNIDAAKQLADIVKTSLGPNDGATIVQELEVMHPAAKMIVLASQMQEQEMGDGTSLVVSMAGELLRLAVPDINACTLNPCAAATAGELLRQGLHTAEILEGYKRAFEKCMEELPSLVCHTVEDVRDKAQLVYAIKTTLASKQYGFEDTLAPYVAEACLNVMPPAPKKASVNVENVRICKLQGGSVDQCHVINGMVKLQSLVLCIAHNLHCTLVITATCERSRAMSLQRYGSMSDANAELQW